MADFVRPRPSAETEASVFHYWEASMKRFLLAVLLGGCTLAAALAQDARYSENGITFDYPKGWKVKTEKPGGIVSVTVQNDNGTQAIVQVHPADADPKKVRS